MAESNIDKCVREALLRSCWDDSCPVHGYKREVQQCPVDAQDDVKLSSKPPESSNDKQHDYLEKVIQSNQAITAAIADQGKSLGQLANSIALLAEAIMEQNQEQDEEDDLPLTFLDGTPTKRF